MRGPAATEGDGTAAEARLPVPAAHVVLWGAILGALLGPLLLFADVPFWSDADRDRANDGPFVLWTVAISLQTMVWVLAFPAIRALSRRWGTPARARSREVRAATAALALFGLAIAVVPPLISDDLAATVPLRGLKMSLLNVSAFLLAIYAARALWFAADELRAVAAASSVDLGSVERHARLRGDLELLLAILGGLVTLAVIAAAALRALTEHVDPARAMPPQAVITYGVVLSVMLALLYVPAYLTMVRSGEILRDRLAPLLPVGDAGFTDRLALRDRLGGLLGLDVSASVSFRAGVAIASPLLGSLTSLLPSLT